MRPLASRLPARTTVSDERIGADADEDALGRRPRPLDGVLAQIDDHLVIDPIGGAPERQLAQGREIAGLEEIIRRALGVLGQIDLAVLEPLDELGRRDVDDHHLIGLLDHGVGHGFAHAHAGDGRHDVGEAFEMLDVDRGPHIDARRDQLLDILVALRMAALGRVRMGELVDDDQLRPALERGIDVEFLDHAAAILDIALRQHLDPLDQRGGLRAPMRFDEADDHIGTLAGRLLGARKHGVGLADARRGAEENLQLAASLAMDEGEQGIRIRAFASLGIGLGHPRIISQ